MVAALLAVSCLAWGVASGAAQPDVRSVADLPAAEGTASGSAETPRAETAPSASGPTVHVAGGVVAPGVYHLAEGARVYEAIAAAGGAEPGADVDRLNLAASIEDGTRLRVPLRGEPEGAETEAGTASGAPAVPGSIAGLPGQASRGPGAAVGAGGRVNINTATAQELGTLPRVGPVLAQRIVDYRTAHGRFAAPEDLDAVSGIGPKMLESLLPLVAVR